MSITPCRSRSPCRENRFSRVDTPGSRAIGQSDP
jgi:hypothetical protein